MVMERPSNAKDLFEVSKEIGAISEEPSKIIFRQIVSTCAELHRRGILHRDIKDENILLDLATLETKIIDFGCATTFNYDKVYTELSGTPEFLAPEVLSPTECRYRAEPSAVWTLGTLLYVLLLGEIPFETTDQILSNKRPKVTIISRHCSFNSSSHQDTEQLLSPSAQNLLQEMLNSDPNKRPSLESILEHKWLSQ